MDPRRDHDQTGANPPTTTPSPAQRHTDQGKPDDRGRPSAPDIPDASPSGTSPPGASDTPAGSTPPGVSDTPAASDPLAASDEPVTTADPVARDTPTEAIDPVIRHHVLAIRHALSDRLGTDLPIRLWDGTEAGSGTFRLALNHPWSLRALLIPATDLNAGEAYLHDDVDVEGDMVAALHAIAQLGTEVGWLDKLRIGRHVIALPSPPDATTTTGRVAMMAGRRHSRERDSAAVRFHYDLGNDFFEQFLDDDLVYSCGYFEHPQTSLEVAQRRKLDTVARKLDLQPGDRVLDVGCGWGSFVMHAAREYGAHAVGVTLSTRQVSLARERVAAAGLSDRVEIRLADYREVDDTFDAIASIGMVEHVGPSHLPEYFSHLYGLLDDGGRLLNHNITTGSRMLVRDMVPDDHTFVGRYVFPDGGLCPAWQTISQVQAAGFELIDVQQLRRHYALTLREWVRRLESHHDAAVATASEEAYRTWRAYMSGSVVGFETNDLGVVQVLGVKGRDDLPLDRSYMAPRVTATDMG